MKNLVYILSCIVLFSCKKEVPKVADFVAVKNSLRAVNEITTIVELIDHSQKPNTINTWFYYQYQIGLDTAFTASLNDIDTIFVNFTSPNTNHDKRLRKGTLVCTFPQEYGDIAQTSTIHLESYFCNNVRITGDLYVTQTTNLSQDIATNPNTYTQQITGNLLFTLYDGSSFTFQPNFLRDYKTGESYYTGSANGIDVNSTSFNLQTSTILKKAAPFVDRAYFYNGKMQITQSNQIGQIWYGYQDVIDDYGFVEWIGSKYNFFLDDY